MSKPRLSQMTSITGAIFAGGQSRRMGQPKEGVRLPDGRAMIQAVLEAMQPVCKQLVIVGDCRGYDLGTHPELIVLPDSQPGQGPLRALETLLASGLSEHYLIAACDQPLLGIDLLRALTGADADTGHLAFFRSASTGEALDPFPGLYPTSLLPTVQRALEAGQSALRPVLRQHPVHWISLPEHQQKLLESLNTPEALANLFPQVEVPS